MRLNSLSLVHSRICTIRKFFALTWADFFYGILQSLISPTKIYHLTKNTSLYYSVTGRFLYHFRSFYGFSYHFFNEIYNTSSIDWLIDLSVSYHASIDWLIDRSLKNGNEFISSTCPNCSKAQKILNFKHRQIDKIQSKKRDSLKKGRKKDC